MCDDDFERIKVLGLGSFGKVTLVRDKHSDNVYALKEIKKGALTDRMKARIQMERNVMALHRNEFMVKLYYAFQSSDRVCMVMDYCAGGDLYFHLQHHRGKHSGLPKFVLSQVLLAIGHLHDHGIVYRDLKPENVLFDNDGYVKLGDFGLSKGGVFSPTEGATSLCGSLYYLAPEVLLLPQRPPESQTYGLAVDYYGLGVLLHEMIFGLPPFFAHNRDEMIEIVETQPLNLSTRIPSNLRDFLARLLKKQAEWRLGSCGGFREVKTHPYLKDVIWEKLSKRQYAPCFVPDAQEMACNFDSSYTRLPVNSTFCDEFKPTSDHDGHQRDESVIVDFEYHHQSAQ
ncbi:unnamed protein product [Heterosigma akashiwo]